ncbi:DNA-binding NarL/FixJ family response regulator [Rhodothalassium salexigens DSM 2132]|nr:response regulator transcription factor [Rhodothalassium salexigens]MBB4212499.1 DNA-binding NarL/FixJ family response regulator [Rhodothalassium salexigens DSM 2132]
MTLAMTTIVISDDHPLFRDALAAAVRRVAPGAKIREAASLAKTRAHLAETPAALVLLDLHMDDSDGFAGLVGIQHDFPAVPVAVVSASDSAGVIARAIGFGAAGFIPKASGLETICAALDAILGGAVWTPPGFDPTAADAETDETAARLATLTPAQVRVLLGLRRGRLNKQIAYDMGITEATVKAHVTAIFRKLGVLNRTQAVLAADVLDVDPDTVTDGA